MNHPNPNSHISSPEAHTRTTLVLGASTKPERYSNIALHMLQDAEESTMAIGLRTGKVAGVPIQTDWDLAKLPPIDTVTLYLNPQRQAPYKEKILALQPRRVIFNPGTENPAFAEELRNVGIEPVFACTLVLLRTGQY
ncbi:MAG: CoA-binding protein [Bacteroidota bacterium]